MTIPGTTPDGEPFIHDVYPAGTLAVWARVRDVLRFRLGDTRTVAGRILFDRITTRVVAASRLRPGDDA